MAHVQHPILIHPRDYCKEGAERIEDPKVVGIYPLMLKDRVSHYSVAL